jgi:hypothetical protein
MFSSHCLSFHKAKSSIKYNFIDCLSKGGCLPNANGETKIDKEDPSKNPSVDTPQTGKKPGDARGDPEQQKRNREDLKVGEDHRTEKMRKGNRGTFP